jgi:hypothetical protein
MQLEEETTSVAKRMSLGIVEWGKVRYMWRLLNQSCWRRDMKTIFFVLSGMQSMAVDGQSCLHRSF